MNEEMSTQEEGPLSEDERQELIQLRYERDLLICCVAAARTSATAEELLNSIPDSEDIQKIVNDASLHPMARADELAGYVSVMEQRRGIFR
jgi:hypothetical protein